MLLFFIGLAAALASSTAATVIILRDARRERQEALDRLNREYRDLCDAEPAL